MRCSNIFYISPAINDSRYYFSLSDIEKFQNGTHEPLIISYEIQKSERVSYNNHETTTKLIITNSEYFTLNRMRFTSGGVWPVKMEKERVAVISEALAWKLFGSISVSGEYIRLSGKEYFVSGVVKQNYYKPDNYFIWTPLSLDINRKESVISKMYISPDTYNQINSYVSIASNIALLNKSVNDYHITDINRYMQSFELRYRIFVFIIGAWFICVIIYKMVFLLKKRPFDTSNWIFWVVFTLLNIITIIIIICGIRFDFWVPKFSNTIITDICQTFFNTGLLPEKEYLSGGILRLYQMNIYANIAFTIGAIGLLNIIFLSKGGFYGEERNTAC